MIPITICLFTSTKGHFGTSRYAETLTHLDRQIPLSSFAGRVASLKVSPGEEARGDEIESDLVKRGFKVFRATAEWRHADQSHQENYFNDICKVYTSEEALATPYVLHLEDDWKLHAFQDDLITWFHRATTILHNDPDILQVRFARFSDEFTRIQGLRAKHGIDAKVNQIEGNAYFTSSDFSLNPSIFRGRDLRAAAILMSRNPNAFPMHVEEGFGRAFKYFAMHEVPLAVLDPLGVKAAHIGSPLGEEDPLDKPLASN